MIYSWGRGDYGQLGSGSTIDQYQPQEISSLHGVQQVSSDWIYCNDLLLLLCYDL